MSRYPQADQIKEVLDQAQSIVIIQADNPDGDSLASALALEAILGDMGKQAHLYCGVNIPNHLRYLSGWDRVSNELPKKFDASIIVDTSNEHLLEQLTKTGQRQWVASKPCIVLDHHDVVANIPYASVICNHSVVSTGELIYELADQLGWKLSLDASQMIAVSILSDSLGLITEATSARSIAIISELVANGVNLAQIDSARRDLMRKSPSLIRYKGQLLGRIQYHLDDRLATVDIPWKEIQEYSPQYNPSMLVIDDMRMTENTALAIAFKIYRDGKITAKIRANFGWPIAGELAKSFGGGGHKYAAGFKITDGRTLEQIKSACLQLTSKLLLEQGPKTNEAL